MPPTAEPTTIRFALVGSIEMARTLPPMFAGPSHSQPGMPPARAGGTKLANVTMTSAMNRRKRIASMGSPPDVHGAGQADPMRMGVS